MRSILIMTEDVIRSGESGWRQISSVLCFRCDFGELFRSLCFIFGDPFFLEISVFVCHSLNLTDECFLDTINIHVLRAALFHKMKIGMG